MLIKGSFTHQIFKVLFYIQLMQSIILHWALKIHQGPNAFWGCRESQQMQKRNANQHLRIGLVNEPLLWWNQQCRRLAASIYSWTYLGSLDSLTAKGISLIEQVSLFGLLLPQKNSLGHRYLIQVGCLTASQPASLPYFVLLVLLVAAVKILTVKVGTSIYPTFLPCQPVSPVLVWLFVPATSPLVEMNFCELICHKQSTFLRYLCTQACKKQPKWQKFA